MHKVIIPQENANDVTVMITWLISGEHVAEGDHIVSFETSKSQIDLYAEAAGEIRWSVCVGDEVDVNSVVGHIDTVQGLSDPIEQCGDGKEPKIHQGDSVVVSRLASYKAEKLIKENNVELDKLDVPRWLISRDLNLGTSSTPVIELAKPSKSNNKSETKFRIVKNALRKRTEIASLEKSSSAGFVSCLGFEILGRRSWRQNPLFDNKISDLVCFESVNLLNSKFADLNAFFKNNTEVGVYEQVLCGFSLDDFEKGGRLAVVRLNPDSFKSIPMLQDEITVVVDQFFNGKVDQRFMGESTFTVTDLSGSGTNFVYPLLNGKQSLIIAISSMNHDRFALHISFDHRVTEGLRIAKFGSELGSRISHHLKQDTFADKECSFCGQKLDAEVQAGNRGLIRLETAKGEELACRVCFDGW